MISNFKFQNTIEPGDVFIHNESPIKSPIKYTFEMFTWCEVKWPMECRKCKGLIKAKELVNSVCMRTNLNNIYYLDYTIIKQNIDFDIKEEDWFI